MKKTCLFILALWTAGCMACNTREHRNQPESVSPNAIRETVRQMREDLEARRDPSDGGGKAWLEPRPMSTIPATAGTGGRWTITYEAGPLGVSEGGAVYFQVSPFWGWSMPQMQTPVAPGFTTVEPQDKGVELKPQNLGQSLVMIEFGRGGLKAGQRIKITYGAGTQGALADRYAERASPFWIAVDGDGDGIRKILSDSPTVDVDVGLPANMMFILPSTARVGETVPLTVVILDKAGNRGYPLEGEVVLDEAPPGFEIPEKIFLFPEDRGIKRVILKVKAEGVYRVRGSGPDRLSAESNPLLVSDQGIRILWGDLQNHSNLSDGTGTPEDVYLYARDAAALDVAAVTDHDHWGMLFLDQHPHLWDEICKQAERFHDPGRFVTLLGYEWTSWIHGHRHVLFFNDHGRVLSSIDPRYDTPRKLWQGLKEFDAMTIAHHSAGSPVGTNWEIPPDPELERVTEVVSVHGSSEAADSPSVVPGAISGNFVRDALDRGYRLGFLGSSDGHDGHPGFAQLQSRTGGLAAILSEELTRKGVKEALQERRVYATSGPRIVIRASLSGRRMGTLLPGPSKEEELVLFAAAPAPIERVDLIRSGKIVESIPGKGQREFQLRRKVINLDSGEYFYIRVVQTDGGMAWTSPFFVL